MIEPAPVPIEVVQYVSDYELNVMAQTSTKRDYPWWWNKYGCSGTQWIGDGPCTDLTE